LGSTGVRGGTRDQTEGPESGFSFAELFQEHYSRIYNYFRYRVEAQQDAEDLTGMAFERAYANQERFDAAKGSFSTWLFRIAHNVLANYYRTRERRAAQARVQDHARGVDGPLQERPLSRNYSTN